MENSVNFKALSEKMTKTDASIEDKSILFKAFFDLKEWIFILPKGKSLEEASPAIEMIDGKAWVMVFTDSTMALEFAKMNAEKYLPDSGQILYLSIKVKDALTMVYDMNKNNVFGLQINFGLPGWYVPVTSLPNIISFLKIML